MTNYILGIHSGHDASACLLKDNEIILAIAKERLTRVKHDSGEPIECIEYILKHAGLKKTDISLVVRNNWHDSTEINDIYYKDFPNVIIKYDHHLFHAYAASLVSTNKKSLILISDGRGARPQDTEDHLSHKDSEYETESIYCLENQKITSLEKYFNKYTANKFFWGSHIESLGYAYAAISKIVFKSSHAAGKIMALASLGKKNKRIPVPFLYDSKQPFIINSSWIQYLEKLDFTVSWDSQLAKDLAYNIQLGLELYFKHRIDSLTKKYQIKDVLLGGGVALNCKNNGLLANAKNINSLGVFCASGDDGLSIGAAVWALRNKFNNYDLVRWKPNLGHTYDMPSTDILTAKKIAQLLMNNKFIGIFLSGSEFGPRALGNRSILASPTDINNKHNLNKFIKKREAFRPFGGIVLAKNLDKLTDDKLASPYMLSAAKISSKYKDLLPALVHYDGSIRLQIINDESSFIFSILNEYEKISGCIALINTSFNGHEEPIVESPDDALISAQMNQLDYLFLNKDLIKIEPAE